MDSRFSFISLFASSDYTIYTDLSISVKAERIKKYWLTLGYKINNSAPNKSDSFLFFYSSKLFTKFNSDPNVNEYFIIPNIQNPRWFILNNSAAINNHGPIIKPTSFKAKIYWFLAKLLNKINLFSLMFPHRLVVKGSSLGRDFYNDNSSVATILYTGAAGKYQKFTIQYSDNKIDFLPNVFLKLSNQKSGINRIANEIQALSSLAQKSFPTLVVPNLIGVIKQCGFYGLLQNNILEAESVFSHFYNLDNLVIAEITSSFDFKTTSVQNFLVSSSLELHIASLNIKGLGSLLDKLGNDKVILAASHGDYIPWNRFINKGTVKVIDWETFGYRPLFYDTFYFILHKIILIENGTVKSALEEGTLAISNALALDKPLTKNKISINLYLILILLLIYSHYMQNETSGGHVFLSKIRAGIGCLYSNGTLDTQ